MMQIVFLSGLLYLEICIPHSLSCYVLCCSFADLGFLETSLAFLI